MDFVGGGPGTAMQDVSHACIVGAERMMDNHSQGAMAQADIERYYASVSVVRVMDYAQKMGGERPLWAAVLRLQMLPEVRSRAMRRPCVCGGRLAAPSREVARPSRSAESPWLQHCAQWRKLADSFLGL